MDFPILYYRFCSLKMRPKLSHEDYMQRVCGVCAKNKRSTVKTMSPAVLQDVQDIHYKGYDKHTMPEVICDTCRLRLKRRKEVQLCSGMLRGLIH